MCDLAAAQSKSSQIFRAKGRKVIKGKRIKTIKKPVSRNF